MGKGRVGNRDSIGGYIGLRSDYSDPIQAIEERIKEIQKLNTKYAILSEDEIKKYKEKQIKDLAKQQKKELQEIQKESETGIKKAARIMSEAVDKAVNRLSTGINAYIETYNKFLSNLNTRLQGTDLSASKIAQNISKNLGTSPYLKQETMMTNLNKFVESGVSYNLELRAYIATATDKIAATFNAFDSSLLRLIRIQQADSTVARLGMESLLTKFLNAQFKDTSYLTSVGTGNISANLLEAESLMGLQRGTEFDYAVQKWLGSMSALGVSSNTISSLAQGLGYLGSGNISAISGNSALQNLLVMASGGSFGNLLTGGLSASSASTLLENIVRFGQSIAASGNNVVLSQYANLFGLSVSDIVSLTNITTQDIKEITKDIVTYETLRNETATQLTNMGQRTSAAEMVSNVLANMKYSLGANIASNPGLLTLWEVGNLISESGLDVDIKPFGIGTTLSTAVRAGALGTSAIMSLINAVGAASAGNLAGTNINAWSNDVTTRGKGLSTLASGGVVTGITTSSSSYIGGVDSGNVSSGFEEIAKTTSEYTGTEEGKTVDKIIENDIAPNVADILRILESWNTNMSILDAVRNR